MKIRIPVCVSFQADIPKELKENPYVLVGCGGYDGDGMGLLDNTGVNISQYNPYVNEMSLVYWMAKNYEKIGNPDYVGLAHYRRCLQHEDWMLQPDAIVCHAENYVNPVYSNYCLYHVKSDIDYTIRMVRDNFSEQTFSSFVRFLNQPYLFERNMFIMPKEKFARYSEFICKCVDLLIENLLNCSDIASRDKYQKRAIGFLCERLTGFWLYDQLVRKESTMILAPIKTFDIESPYQRPE